MSKNSQIHFRNLEAFTDKIYKPEYFIYAAQKMKFSIKDFLSKCDQIARNCWFGHIQWKNPSWKTTF